MKVILSAAVVGAFLVGSVGFASADHNDHGVKGKSYDHSVKIKSFGKPFMELQQQLDAMQAQLDVLRKMPGPEGQVGPIGPVGPQGPAGETGAIGQTGPQGPQGPVGPIGPIGPQGLAGEAGAIGQTGPQGPQGPVGSVGPIGPAGPQGPAGEAGAIGQTGPQGPQGPVGSVGPIGPAGPQGLAGKAGATGQTGPRGPQGFTGAEGLSCWDLNGNFIADTNEDVNGDGAWDALDCQGNGTSSVPAIWSGYCSTDGKLSGWNSYCTTAVDFNTANNYLTANSNGTFVTLVSGFYRINAWTISNVSDWAYIRLVVNGVEQNYSYAYSGNKWVYNNMDLVWPMNAGDSFQIEYYNSGGNSYAFKSGSENGKYSRLQVSFVGPMQ